MASIDQDPAELTIETSAEADGTPVVIVSGELDSANAASLETVVSSISDEKPPKLFFDLSDLRFMDSAGIAILLRAARESAVHLRQPSGVVRRVIETTGLVDVLHMEP